MTPSKEALIESAMTTLGAMGIPYLTNNGGVHLRIQGLSPGQRADLWPTTERWSIFYGDRMKKGTKLHVFFELIEGWAIN